MAGYAFLELLKEQEALARGANLGDKVHHAIFKAIKGSSTVDAVRNNSLYHVGVNVPEVLHLTKKDLLQVLTRLVSEKLITQIFLFHFEPGSAQPSFRPCFLSIPADEKQSVGQIFQEGIVLSARAIESYIDSLPIATPETIWADLETDLKMDTQPLPADLPATIVDLFSNVHAANFEVVPQPEMIQATLAGIQEFLAKRGRLSEVVDYGFLPVKERELLDRVESAGDFLLSKVIPKYKTRGSLKAELEQVHLEEATYYLNENVPRTAEYLARRATLIKKTILSEPNRKGGLRYPGMLAVETLILLEPFSRSKYAEQWKAEVASVHGEFKQRLMQKGIPWDETILFLQEKEAAAFPREAWMRILDDRDILHNLWETPTHSVHVFLRKDAEVFRDLVNGMLDAVPEEYWKILAMKFLLDKYESNFSGLFHDEVFVRSYGKLLRAAYINYIPWFYRIFILLGLKWFQDKSFQIAKQKITNEQRGLASVNQQKVESIRAAREQEKRQMMNRIQEMSVANEIIEVLDRFYHSESKIPTVNEVQSAIKDGDPAAFREALQKNRFQIVREGKGDKPDQDILVYPMNAEWRVRAARLRRAVDRISQNFPATMQSDEARRVHDRLKRLQKFLARKEKELPIADPEEPYKRFEKAVKAVKQRDALEEDELDV